MVLRNSNICWVKARKETLLTHSFPTLIALPGTVNPPKWGKINRGGNQNGMKSGSKASVISTVRPANGSEPPVRAAAAPTRAPGGRQRSEAGDNKARRLRGRLVTTIPFKVEMEGAKRPGHRGHMTPGKASVPPRTTLQWGDRIGGQLELDRDGAIAHSKPEGAPGLGLRPPPFPLPPGPTPRGAPHEGGEPRRRRTAAARLGSGRWSRPRPREVGHFCHLVVQLLECGGDGGQLSRHLLAGPGLLGGPDASCPSMLGRVLDARGGVRRYFLTAAILLHRFVFRFALLPVGGTEGKSHISSNHCRAAHCV